MPLFRRSEPALLIRDRGFDIRVGKQCWSIEWARIARIIAFKRDAITTDTLSLEIEVDDGTCYEVNEDMEGFSEFERSLSTLFPLPRDWRREVLFPAFLRNE